MSQRQVGHQIDAAARVAEAGGTVVSGTRLAHPSIVIGILDRPNTDPAIVAPSSVGNDRLRLAPDFASTRRAIVIAAAGSYGRNTGSLLISRHSVVPVASCDEPDVDAQFELRGIDRAARRACAPLRHQSQLQLKE